MVRTQISLDDSRANALDIVVERAQQGRSVAIRAAVDRLVRLSSQSAAEALLALAHEFATPGMADVAQHHDELLGEGRW